MRTLSKGNRQKIGLILAFIHRPELLVLDEPTSGLDPLLQDEFDQLLRETVADGRTVFLSSHELDEVQRAADRVAIIKDGPIVLVDTVAGAARQRTTHRGVRFDRPVDADGLRRTDRRRGDRATGTGGRGCRPDRAGRAVATEAAPARTRST